jgi:hypothetical protein
MTWDKVRAKPYFWRQWIIPRPFIYSKYLKQVKINQKFANSFKALSFSAQYNKIEMEFILKATFSPMKLLQLHHHDPRSTSVRFPLPLVHPQVHQAISK